MKPEHRVVCDCGIAKYPTKFNFFKCHDHEQFGIVDARNCFTLARCNDAFVAVEAHVVLAKYVRLSSEAWPSLRNAMEKNGHETVDEEGRLIMWPALVILDDSLMVWEEVQEP